MITRGLVESIGFSYPERFGIDLRADPFPWFLLSVLFGARITESIAIRTFILFRSEGLMSPESLISMGWDGLVALLDSGGYTRYDFRTATKLLEMSKNILSSGSLPEIHRNSENPEELVLSLKRLAKGIGDVTVGIFLREMVGIWDKAAPHPSGIVMRAAEMLGIDSYTFHRSIGVPYGKMESFLVTVGKQCFRSGCRKCIFPDKCLAYMKAHGLEKPTRSP